MPCPLPGVNLRQHPLPSSARKAAGTSQSNPLRHGHKCHDSMIEDFRLCTEPGFRRFEKARGTKVGIVKDRSPRHGTELGFVHFDGLKKRFFQMVHRIRKIMSDSGGDHGAVDDEVAKDYGSHIDWALAPDPRNDWGLLSFDVLEAVHGRKWEEVKVLQQRKVQAQMFEDFRRRFPGLTQEEAIRQFEHDRQTGQL
eukprot:TRINITY_DN2389_c0_g1_i1.p1 TRINITY_DN2389_c0_g1~~TRINITY_DN2389_c0_g1_i1.p1  ORF type:complete len:196 (+),score=32.59 TRINITY_DN2389_c0_g1_i1:80-667(+)